MGERNLVFKKTTEVKNFFIFRKIDRSFRLARRHCSAINHACTIEPRALLFELRISKKEHNARENYGACILFKIRIQNSTPAVLPACNLHVVVLSFN